MGIKEVKRFFRSYDMEDRVRQFEVSSATVELAALALNCEPERIAKTLSFWVDKTPVLVVCAGDVKVDNKKFKSRFGKKPKMLSPKEAEDFVGHKVGGLCPFAVKDGVSVYLDRSLKRFETIFPACGDSSSAIELTIPEIVSFSRSLGWVDVCKGLS